MAEYDRLNADPNAPVKMRLGFDANGNPIQPDERAALIAARPKPVPEPEPKLEAPKARAQRRPFKTEHAGERGVLREQAALREARKRVKDDGVPRAVVRFNGRHYVVTATEADKIRKAGDPNVEVVRDLKPAAAVNGSAPRKGLAGIFQRSGLLLNKQSLVSEGDDRGLPGGRVFTNDAINSTDDAIQFVRNGGALNRLPNEYWSEALKANASKDAVDATTRFKIIPKKGGIVGDTHIYVERRPDGTGDHNKGWVLKAASGQEGAFEVAAFNLSVAHGFPGEGAAWDGLNDAGQPFAIIPHTLNMIDTDGVDVKAGADNYDPSLFRRLPDQALPMRVAHLLHNYLMGVTDRHNGNGWTTMVDGKPVIMPIDQGWSGFASWGRFPDAVAQTKGLADYAAEFTMDRRLFVQARDHAATLSPEDQAAFKESVVEVYDDMIERGDAVVAAGKEAFVTRALKGAPDVVKQPAAGPNRPLEDHKVIFADIKKDPAAVIAAGRQAFVDRVVANLPDADKANAGLQAGFIFDRMPNNADRWAREGEAKMITRLRTPHVGGDRGEAKALEVLYNGYKARVEKLKTDRHAVMPWA